MLYQQINDLAITGHNWLWNKGYNILSISLQLFSTLFCSLLLVLPESSTCPLFAPSFHSPLPLLFPLSTSLERTTTAPSVPLSSEEDIWKTGSVFATLHHIQSSPCLFSSPPFPPSLSTPFSLLLSHPPSSPCLLCISSEPQHHLSQSCISPYLSISPQLSSSLPSCLCLKPLALSFPLCLKVFLSWKMQYICIV